MLVDPRRRGILGSMPEPNGASAINRTTTALLDDLADPSNDAAWTELDARFRPIVFGVARRLGLAEEDAADATQEALTRFVRAYRAGKYDRSKGRLQSWMIGITRNAVAEVRTSRAMRRERRGMSAVDTLPDNDEFQTIWDDQFRQEILRRGMLRLRTETRTDERTIEAFEMLTFQSVKAHNVAERLGMSRNDVYLAKHRCLTRLREIMTDLEDAFAN